MGARSSRWCFQSGFTSFFAQSFVFTVPPDFAPLDSCGAGFRHVSETDFRNILDIHGLPTVKNSQVSHSHSSEVFGLGHIPFLALGAGVGRFVVFRDSIEAHGLLLGISRWVGGSVEHG